MKLFNWSHTARTKRIHDASWHEFFLSNDKTLEAKTTIYLEQILYPYWPWLVPARIGLVFIVGILMSVNSVRIPILDGLIIGIIMVPAVMLLTGEFFDSTTSSSREKKRNDIHETVKVGSILIIESLNHIERKEDKILIIDDAISVAKRELDKNDTFGSKILFGLVAFFTGLMANHFDRISKLFADVNSYTVSGTGMIIFVSLGVIYTTYFVHDPKAFFEWNPALKTKALEETMLLLAKEKILAK
ncbi:hypothetical protein [Weissella confusa]|uniref:hypothetical protein n=1 Tax=Weissella confusa TaxID=1583 RepID=UPI0022FEBC99|nr:hypothetical protein [Weissella confusa]MDA5457676.1 hypothetical protein [Weissella confusa]